MLMLSIAGYIVVFIPQHSVMMYMYLCYDVYVTGQNYSQVKNFLT